MDDWMNNSDHDGQGTSGAGRTQRIDIPVTLLHTRLRRSRVQVEQPPAATKRRPCTMIDVLKAQCGRAADADAPDGQPVLGGTERDRRRTVRPA
jgi:hypothetical protein